MLCYTNQVHTANPLFHKRSATGNYTELKLHTFMAPSEYLNEGTIYQLIQYAWVYGR